MGQVHIFTAATKSYAEPVIDMIDPNGYVTGRYYREVRYILSIILMIAL
jgi:TFIIF-interacting CTD phosphatase-like protein